MPKPQCGSHKSAIGASLLALLCAAGGGFGADFRLATPGYQFEFPRDHGSHEEYRTEWWYYTGNLRTAEGRRYGFEVTFFRVGVVPPPREAATKWDLHDLALAHFAITDLEKNSFRYYEKLNRSSVFTARAATGYLDVFNEGWRATTVRDGAWRLTAAGGSDAIDLVLRTQKPPAIHGTNGVSVKAFGEGHASHYYSMTRLHVTGTINGAKCSGLAWMDHEFGSSALRENQQGWDWFSVQLDNDTELMLYQIRRTDGSPDVTSSGSLVTSEGEVIHIRHDQMMVEALGRWKSPRSGAEYPSGWRISVPSLRIVLTVQPLMKEQELITTASTQITYWEGAVGVTGTSGGTAVRGEGYVELTGYDRAFRAP